VIYLSQNAVLSSGSFSKHSPAKKCTIKYLYEFKQLQQKVHVKGIIVGLTNQNQLILDDGSGQMIARVPYLKEHISKVEIGDLVTIIGTISSFNNIEYLAAEIVKKVKNKLWVKVHQLESDIYKDNVTADGSLVEIDIENEGKNPSELILDMIRKIDSGEGVLVSDVENRSQVDGSRKLIDKLLRDGEIYEVAPGKIRAL
jgi:hypothetical protein